VQHLARQIDVGLALARVVGGKRRCSIGTLLPVWCTTFSASSFIVNSCGLPRFTGR
jgi:hypothetical protein